MSEISQKIITCKGGCPTFIDMTFEA